MIAEFSPLLDAKELAAAKAAAAVMGMHNVYYRFLHLVERAPLRLPPEGCNNHFGVMPDAFLFTK